MPSSAPARNAPGIRVRKSRVTGLLVVVAAAALALGHSSLTSSSSSPPAHPTATTQIRLPRTDSPGAPRRVEGVIPHSRHGGARFGEAGGAVPAGTTVFDDEVPGVAKLNPTLLRALRRAATDAGAGGVDFIVNSGWRSVAYEDQLRREAIAKYGSEAEAARWVATGTTSPHVAGDAVDLGSAGAAWLSEHGARYGLCQIYVNEPWHYEWRPSAIDHGCPGMYADPTQDPRMQP